MSEDSGWKVHWRVTECSGLMVYLVDYGGKAVLWEGRLPYVTVDHQSESLSLEGATRSGHGPFWTPLGIRTQASEVASRPFRGGFELTVDFAAGPYSYTQLWRFHRDGRMAPWLTIHGAGIHDAHTYHPHWRFDFDINGSDRDVLERFENGRWTRIEQEGWFPFAGEANTDGSAWRQLDLDSGAALLIRPHHWEDAELFAIRQEHDQWSPTSPHSEAGGEIFPGGYAGARPIDEGDVTLWYVAHVHYDASFPFTAGPWIRLQGY